MEAESIVPHATKARSVVASRSPGTRPGSSVVAAAAAAHANFAEQGRGNVGWFGKTVPINGEVIQGFDH